MLDDFIVGCIGFMDMVFVVECMLDVVVCEVGFVESFVDLEIVLVWDVVVCRLVVCKVGVV